MLHAVIPTLIRVAGKIIVNQEKPVDLNRAMWRRWTAIGRMNDLSISNDLPVPVS
jgi:hypothetical protein